MTKPLYVMLIGPPASGKTTLRGMIVDKFTTCWHVVSTDDYVELVAKGNGTTYEKVFSTAIDAATKNMNASLANALKNGYSILHDQTNLTVKSRNRSLSQVPATYAKIGLVCWVPSYIRQQRLEQRVGKTIPPYVDADMVARFEFPSTNEGFDVVGHAAEWCTLLSPYIG